MEAKREAPCKDMMSLDLQIMTIIATIVEDPNTFQINTQILPREKMSHLEEKEGVEKISHLGEREGVGMIDMNEDLLGEAMIQKGRDKSSKRYSRRISQAHIGEWVSGSDFDNQFERSCHSDSDYS